MRNRARTSCFIGASCGWALGLVAALWSGAPIGAGVRASEPAPSVPAAPGAPAPPGQEPIPPQIRLGLRVEAVSRNIPTSPDVVVVSSGAAYVQAIAGWTLRLRYPVLLDDGTPQAREDIARFVRAFGAREVLLWPGAPADLGAVNQGISPLPEDRLARQTHIRRAMERAWGAEGDEALRAVWAATRFEPPGLVIAHTEDPAWTAALALAAGHGQPIAWLDELPDPPGPVGAMLGAPALARLASTIERALEASGFSWRDPGDQLEALTLCLNIPSRIQLTQGAMALTDRLGRHDDDQRYAWCGQVFGTESQAAYRAMSALFLRPRQAWMFDGYKPGFAKPYELPDAADTLRAAGLEVRASTPPLSGLEHWRQRAAPVIRAGLVMVNSSGRSVEFNLTPGTGTAGDVPLLDVPAAVYLIHSFSAQAPGDPSTIGGRWLAQGAHVYYGSMDEPFLGAFFPAGAVARRWSAGAPLGVAVRQDTMPTWKLNYFGDPLLMLRPGAAPGADAPPPVPGARALSSEMKQALPARRLAEGVRALVLLGRDEDAARLAQAALGDAPEGERPLIAEAGVRAAARRGDRALAITLFKALGAPHRDDPILVDLLWQCARPGLADTTDAELVALLRERIRRHSLVEDAQTLAPAVARVFGAESAGSFVAGLAARAPDAHAADRLRELGRRVAP